MSGESGYHCPKCHFQWDSVDAPSKCWNCGFDWVDKQESRADLIALVKELEAVEHHMNYCRSLLNTSSDDVLSESIKELQAQLHQRDTALVAAREALEKSVRVMSAIKHATEHNQPIPWNGVCERLSAAIEASKSAMHPNET